MDCRVLGQLTVRSGATVGCLTAPKPRKVLALLLVRANLVVPIETLSRELWRDEPPASAQTTLQTYVLQVRRMLAQTLGISSDRGGPRHPGHRRRRLPAPRPAGRARPARVRAAGRRRPGARSPSGDDALGSAPAGQGAEAVAGRRAGRRAARPGADRGGQPAGGEPAGHVPAALRRRAAARPAPRGALRAEQPGRPAPAARGSPGAVHGRPLPRRAAHRRAQRLPPAAHDPARGRRAGAVAAHPPPSARDPHRRSGAGNFAFSAMQQLA